MEEASIKNQIKDEMMQEFKSFTPKEVRKMIKSSKILLLPNWDIANAMVFNSVTKKLNVDEKVKKEIKGAKFSEDNATLVIWSMRKGSKASSSQLDDNNLVGNLNVKRVEDTSSEEAIELNVKTTNLTLATNLREKRDRLESQEKYEKLLATYNREVQKRIELENKVMGHQVQSSRPRITYPCPLVESLKSTPSIEIPNTPQRPKYYTTKDFEEKSKLWALHVELDIEYEDRLKKAIMYLVDKIGWPTFYLQL